MARTAHLPHRDAIVKISRDDERTWTTVESIRPLTLDVESDGEMADVFQPTLGGLMDSLVLWESMDSSASYRLVWSDTGYMVRGVCPVCDDVFPVSEGFSGDEANEGYEAVCCGCNPADNEED